MNIELQGVWKGYGQGATFVWALADVHLEVRSGCYLAVTGPSGSGKSTLLHILGLLDRPSQGSVLVDGVDTQKLSDRELSRIRRDCLGFVFQSFYLNENLTAFQNVLVVLELARRRDRRRRAQEVLMWMGLDGKGHRYPSQLSGGEQQRVAIARALANSPQLLLADEPTGNLDSQTGAKIIDLLEQIRTEHGLGLVLVTHDEGLAQRAVKRVRLRDGRIRGGVP